MYFKWYNHRSIALGHMTLERLVFDFTESPFLITKKTFLCAKNVVMTGCGRGVGVCLPIRNGCLHNA